MEHSHTVEASTWELVAMALTTVYKEENTWKHICIDIKHLQIFKKEKKR